ncbi:MAG: hypothetical protein ACKODP_03555 [Actinomycetota bacterium]
MAKDEIEPEEIDEELEIEDDALDLDEDFEETSLDLDDDAADEGDDDESDVGTTVVRKAGDDDEDDEDMLAPDDVEADLDTILKDRLASEDVAAEDEEEVETDDRSGADDALQPKRADELLCSSCFLLVRKGAPTCPVGDDACPVFAK